MKVRGVGPIPCDFMLVGEGPGPQEDRQGIPFVGKTGNELDRHLDGSTLPAREDVFLTNLYRFYGGKDYIFTAEDLARDEPDLLADLDLVRPKLVITMGRHSTRWFMGDVDMDDVHGIPYYLPKTHPYYERIGHFGGDEQVIIFPMYHIAAGFYSPDLSGTILYDFQQLKALFNGTVQPRTLYDDPYPSPVYEEITDPDDPRLRLDPRLPLAIDTEGSTQFPWSLQYSQRPGTAYIVRAANRLCVSAAIRSIVSYRNAGGQITYHNSLHDIPMLRAFGCTRELVGVDAGELAFGDTMVAAYLLQVEPKGLKPLCVRHCNMQMQSYEDVLGDAENRLAYDYFTAIWDCEQADYEVRQQAEFEVINTTPFLNDDGSLKVTKDGRVRYHKTTKLPDVPKTALHKAVERGIRSRTPVKLWEKWDDEHPEIVTQAIHTLGPLPVASLDHVPLANAIFYGGRDSDGTVRLEPELGTRLDGLGLRGVYALELGTYPLIDRMHTIGIKPDLAHFAALSTDLQTEIDGLQIALESQTGVEGFNANSGDQVADFVFDRLGLEGVKKTESGRFSTNDKVLEALEHEHPEFPVLGTIREFREVYKLKHTFVDRIPDFVHRYPFDGRVHATFRTTRVVTGRLAASDPNLLAQPKHGKFAKRFRKGWVAAEGWCLGEWDLSQIELRVLAHLSQDPVMLAIFRGEKRNPDGSLIDLHAALAQRIFGVAPKDQDKSKHRLPAKAINFGLPMGMQAQGLTVELRKNGVAIDEDDAQKWIDETMSLYKGVPAYQQGCIAEAKRAGFIRCLSGRIRYIGGIKSRDDRIRSEAERFAFSTKIQEGAQWIMKQNEASIWSDIIVPYGGQVQPLLQVHDAIDLEFRDTPELARDVNREMMRIMTRAPKGFSVPIDSSGDYGYNMADMKEFV